MCFYVSNNLKHRRVKVAKKDIICYKVLINEKKHKFLYAPLRSFTYQIRRNCFFSFTKKQKLKVILFGSRYQIHEGFHSFSNKKKLRGKIGFGSRKAFLCVIPKGSEYFYNPEKMEYVSEYIRVVKQIYL